MKIYVACPLPESDRLTLGAATPADEVWYADPARPSAADREAFLAAEVVFGAFPEDLLAAAPQLRWIQFSSAGVDNFLHLNWTAVAGRVTCTNMRGVFVEAMVQTVLGGLLALVRGIDQFARLQPQRNWQKPRLQSGLRRLDGLHVLLLGAGSANRRLQELLLPFHCTFTAYGRTSGDIHTLAELDAALPRADIVCAALPDTPDTRGLIDAARLQHFKPGALFANIGRGSLVDEPALVDALHSGRLGGAVLDVTRHEPLLADDPLWNCPRTILTQHTGGGSDQVFRDAVAFFTSNLARYRADEPLQNVIDWSKGY